MTSGGNVPPRIPGACRDMPILNLLGILSCSRSLDHVTQETPYWSSYFTSTFIVLVTEPPILNAYNKTDVILRLPNGKRIRDMRWLSVWCRRFTNMLNGEKCDIHLKELCVVSPPAPVTLEL
ncbi:hypothetical protein J6590_060350 [Homalodisca vitripennis]|nr:hypothetical protein J6590_060350 [Homalodisca vitripennis]